MEHTLSPEGKNERLASIEKAREIYDELRGFDGQVVDRETHDHIEVLASELSKQLQGLSWRERLENNLPWNPRDEMVKEAA